jgi:hypothetical protein
MGRPAHELCRVIRWPAFGAAVRILAAATHLRLAPEAAFSRAETTPGGMDHDESTATGSPRRASYHGGGDGAALAADLLEAARGLYWRRRAGETDRREPARRPPAAPPPVALARRRDHVPLELLQRAAHQFRRLWFRSPGFPSARASSPTAGAAPMPRARPDRPARPALQPPLAARQKRSSSCRNRSRRAPSSCPRASPS